MKEKIKKYWWVIIIVLFVGGIFYWYEWRPTQIRKHCYDISLPGVPENFDLNYQSCLKDSGLIK